MKCALLTLLCSSYLLFAGELVKTFSDSLVEELNLFRSNPSLYADTYIKPMLISNVKGAVKYPSGRLIESQEGMTVIMECIQFLHRSEVMPPLLLNRGMSRGSLDHVKDQSLSGGEGHTGSDGGDVGDRVNRYGKWYSSVASALATEL